MTPQDPFEAFRRSSHEERDIPYEPDDWTALHRRLDADAAPARSLSPWWMLLLLVPLSGLFYLQQRNMGQQQALNVSLLEEVRTLRQTINAAATASRVVHSTDTVYQERVVYQDRTVYRTAEDTPGLRAGSLLRFPLSPGPNRYAASFGGAGEKGDVAGGSSGKMFRRVSLEESIFSSGLPSPAGDIIPTNDLDIVALNDLNDEWSLSVDQLPRMGIEQLAPPFLLPKPRSISVQSFLRRRIVRGPIVKGLNLDFAADVSAATEEDQEVLPALLTDLRLGARLGKGWSLFIGVAGEYAKYEFEDFDPAIGLDPFPAPIEEFSFENAALRRYTAYGQLGLGWQLPTDGRWSPFIDLAYLRGISSKSQLDYYYENNMEQDIVVERPDRYNLPANLLNFGGGMFYSPKTAGWRIGLGGRYQLPLGQDQLNPARLGLDLRLGYRF